MNHKINPPFLWPFGPENWRIFYVLSDMFLHISTYRHLSPKSFVIFYGYLYIFILTVLFCRILENCFLSVADTCVILLSKHQILSRNNIYYIIPSESPLCPYCQGTLRIRDTKHRKAIESDGTVHHFCLRRLKCDRCGVMHAELPDVLIPRKHYTRKAIESALSGARAACQAESSTIYRWSRERNAHIV